MSRQFGGPAPIKRKKLKRNEHRKCVKKESKKLQLLLKERKKDLRARIRTLKRLSKLETQKGLRRLKLN